MLTDSRIIKYKIELLNLAEEFKNILKVSKIKSAFRDTFYYA
ncbi:hypothetical protein SAMN05428952_11142 [Nitrosomonas sp. Nm132]|nr:hypothetical protein SAMN05428952_11142 [Nitrosomonas sp. Nm132]